MLSLSYSGRHHSDDSGVDDLNNRRVGLTQALLSKLQRLSGFVDEVTEELEPLSPRCVCVSYIATHFYSYDGVSFACCGCPHYGNVHCSM